MSQSLSHLKYFMAYTMEPYPLSALGMVEKAGRFIIRYLYKFKKCMSSTTEDNLGRRRFQLHRDMAVEQSLEKIRRAPDSAWETLTPEQRARLKTVLAEIWENCEHRRWEQYCFSTITRPDILRLITLADETRARHQQVCDARGDFEAILLSCGMDNRSK